MLLRLHVRGFKNLRDLDVRFGPLTCLVGPNGVGKSNLFDSIQFLRHLAEDEIHVAADAIRAPNEGGFGPLDLLWNRDPTTEIRLLADMLVPETAEDDFGREVRAGSTLLRYEVAFRYSSEQLRLELVHEELLALRKSNARRHVAFPHNAAFIQSTVKGKRSGGPYIATEVEDGRPRIELHKDGGSRGRPVPAGTSPRTVLGGTNTQDYPTVVAARREMLSWHSLHLEPSSLRTPDRIGERAPVDEHGRHIAATLQRLGNATGDVDRVCAQVANQLARLVPAVRAVRINTDEARQHQVVEVQLAGSPFWLPPRSLSDGTLRYLALAVMQMDSQSSRVLCIEEPENGIHPTQIPVAVQVLQDYAVDPKLGVDDGDNPLRQVILNTHSPKVVEQLGPDDVLFVETLVGPFGAEASIRAVDHDRQWRDPTDHGLIGRAELEQWHLGLPSFPPAQQKLPF